MYCVGAKPAEIAKMLKDPKAWIVISNNEKSRAVWKTVVGNAISLSEIKDGIADSQNVIFANCLQDEVMRKCKKWIVLSAKPDLALFTSLRSFDPNIRVLVHRAKSETTLRSYFDVFKPELDFTNFAQNVRAAKRKLVPVVFTQFVQTELRNTEHPQIEMKLYPDVTKTVKTLLLQDSLISKMVLSSDFASFPDHVDIKLFIRKERVDTCRMLIWSFLDALKSQNIISRGTILI